MQNSCCGLAVPPWRVISAPAAWQTLKSLSACARRAGEQAKSRITVTKRIKNLLITTRPGRLLPRIQSQRNAAFPLGPISYVFRAFLLRASAFLHMVPAHLRD